MVDALRDFVCNGPWTREERVYVMACVRGVDGRHQSRDFVYSAICMRKCANVYGDGLPMLKMMYTFNEIPHLIAYYRRRKAANDAPVECANV